MVTIQQSLFGCLALRLLEQSEPPSINQCTPPEDDSIPLVPEYCHHISYLTDETHNEDAHYSV